MAKHYRHQDTKAQKGLLTNGVSSWQLFRLVRVGFRPSEKQETFCAMGAFVVGSLPADTRETVGFI